MLLALITHHSLLLTSSAQNTDSLLLDRVFSFQRNYAHDVVSFETNTYEKYLYQSRQRNFTLWLIPHMYSIAHGQRSFVSEEYGRLILKEGSEPEHLRQVYYTTIPHNRRTLPTLPEYAIPMLYNETLYANHILSPFCRTNRVFYRYSTTLLNKKNARLYFRPRYVKNTQLVTGSATVDLQTGRIIDAQIDGEFDMMHFTTLTQQGDYGARALMPKFCRTSADFKFLGNHISSAFEVVYDCPVTLPDTLSVKGDRQLIDSIRPVSLSAEEQAIYDQRDFREQQDAINDSIEQSQKTDSIEQRPRRNILKEIGWEVGDNLVRTHRADFGTGYVRLSPLINPQYVSYSKSKGFSYKLKLRAELNLNDHTAFDIDSRLGYNFKQKKFYFDLPLRLNYLFRKRNAYAEIALASSNRIYNSTVMDELRRSKPDITWLEDMRLDQFDDWNMHLKNFLPLNYRLAIEAGVVVHQRKAVNKNGMNQLGLPTEYRSVAPSVTIQTRPWPKGPLFTLDYERGMSFKASDLTYERWELDASLKHRLHRLQTLNLRFGAGFYTRRDRNYFMDYSNFRDENLPGGWDDDWSGNFQLLDSRIYNESDHYLRGNVSFESPLMAASFIPLVGRYVERERIYLSSLSIASTRLYSELGYGFTCRFFSMGFFASFLNTQFQETGAKFTFELFRRW